MPSRHPFLFVMGGEVTCSHLKNPIFCVNGQKKDVISSSSSLDAIEVAKEKFEPVGKIFIFESLRIERWILDVEGSLDVLRHSKIMGVNQVSVALPLCLDAVLLADQIGCDCIGYSVQLQGLKKEYNVLK